MATILQFCTSIAASRVDSFVYSAMIATRVQSNSQNSSFSSLKLGVQFIHNLQRQAKLLVISTTVLFSDFDELLHRWRDSLYKPKRLNCWNKNGTSGTSSKASKETGWTNWTLSILEYPSARSRTNPLPAPPVPPGFDGLRTCIRNFKKATTSRDNASVFAFTQIRSHSHVCRAC